MDEIVKKLNEKYTPLSQLERLKEIFNDFDEGKILITSSFGSSSVYLLSLLSKVKEGATVHFIDTTYHFKETYIYKEYIKAYFKLNIVDIKPNEVDNDYTTRHQTWKLDPDFCCRINKVDPLNAVKKDYDLWISGLMHFQNSTRKNMPLFEQNGILKFYPILDADKQQLIDFIRDNNLPQHPLAVRGFESIGCKHCTVKGNGRSGRWNFTSKTECGLHEYPSVKIERPKRKAI